MGRSATLLRRLRTLAAVHGLVLCGAAAAQGATDLPDAGTLRRALRHGELLGTLTAALDAAAPEHRQALATDLARVRLEAELLRRVAPLPEVAGESPAAVLRRAAELTKSGPEEIVLARLAFLCGATTIGEDALGRARDTDPDLRNETDRILAAARREGVPRGGYFRYRGAWLPLAERDECRALDRALEAIDRVAIVGLAKPLRPDPRTTNRDRFAALGDGVGIDRMRRACAQITTHLDADYATVRGWLRSYAAQPALREQMLAEREALRVVQNEALALIGHYTKLEQGQVDLYRERLASMYAGFERLVSRDFAALQRFDRAKAFALHERLRRREAALAAVDGYLAQTKRARLDATPVRPENGSTVTTAHLLPGRRMSGLEDTLWLLVKHRAGQVLDVFDRGAEILRHAKRLTPWERLILEIVVADATDAYNARAAVSLDATEREFMMILNRYRRTLGLRPFEIEERLNAASLKHSREMIELRYFGHVSPVPRNRTPSDRARLEGYAGGVGENCLSGSESARGAFEGWYHSPGHHRGMVSRSPHLGVGRAHPSMWTMVMGGTDWTWRRLHRDREHGVAARHDALVAEFAKLAGRSGTPPEKIATRIGQLRTAITAALPAALPSLARAAFPAARDRRHDNHAASPTLLGLLVDADAGTPWRPLQIAAIAAAIDVMQRSDRSTIRAGAWAVVAPHLQRPFTYDPEAGDGRLQEVVREVRTHWEDIAQWRFRSASGGGPPAPRRIAGRKGEDRAPVPPAA